MPMIRLFAGISLCAILVSGARAQVSDFTSKPNDDSNDEIKSEIGSGDPAQVAHAVGQIQYWIHNRHVVIDTWRQWLPALMNTRHYQEAADVSLAAAAGRPGIDGIEPLLEFRVKALLALNQPEAALSAAKSYYNVCQLKSTGNAVTLVASCLAAAHPEDTGIAARFRYQQAMASAAAYGTTRPSVQVSMLQSVHVDGQPYHDAILNIVDSVGKANLLLAADRPTEAEAIFRKIYLSAQTQAELSTGIDGIARSLRAEDGNVGRADSWLLALQQAKAGN